MSVDPGLPRVLPPDLEWEEGAVPHRLPRAAFRGPLVEASTTHGLFRMPGVGRYLLPPTGPVIVAASPGAGQDDIDCFFSTSVAALAGLLAGLYPLHGAAVALDSRAVVILGPAGVGKSTLAAALVGRGHQLLADGVILIERSPCRVAPTTTDVRLWPDAAQALGLDLNAGQVIRPTLASRRWALGRPTTEPAALDAVVIVVEDGRVDPTSGVEVESMRASDAFAHLVGAEWFPMAVGPLGRALDHFEHWVEVCSGIRRIARISRGTGPPSGFARSAAEVVESMLR